MARSLAEILEVIGVSPRDFAWRNMCSRVGSAGSGMPADWPAGRVVDAAKSNVDFCEGEGGCCEGCWAKAILDAVSAEKVEQKAI